MEVKDPEAARRGLPRIDPLRLYLRPLVGEKVVARAFLLKAGKTLCVSRVDMSDDQGRLGAVAIVTYLVLSQSRVSAV